MVALPYYAAAAMPEPIFVNEVVSVPESAISVSHARSSGPGGQNVNKVASKVDVRIDLAAIVGMADDARERLLVSVRTKLDADGHLQVVSQKTRDQAKNLADAMEKVRVLIEAALVAPIVRKPTKPGRAAVRRRLAEKKATGERKKARSTKPDAD